MAGGHQMVYCENGLPKSAMGSNGLWGLAVYDGAGTARQRVYSPNNKPSKADVGLNLVNNWGVTSSVTDASTMKYATPKAVKIAYDKAVSAFNLAGTKITAGQGDGRYLGKTAKAADANKLDNKDSSEFVQTSGAQTVAGKKTFNDEIGLTDKASIKYNAATDSIDFIFA